MSRLEKNTGSVTDRVHFSDSRFLPKEKISQPSHRILKRRLEFFCCTCHTAGMNNTKIAPARSKFTILQQLCNYIPPFLVPKIARTPRARSSSSSGPGRALAGKPRIGSSGKARRSPVWTSMKRRRRPPPEKSQQIRRWHRCGGDGHLELRPGHWPGLRYYESREHPQNAVPGRARLRRVRFDLRDRRSFCAERHDRPHSRRPVGALTFNINVTGSYLVADGGENLAGAGLARQSGADDERECIQNQNGVLNCSKRIEHLATSPFKKSLSSQA